MAWTKKKNKNKKKGVKRKKWNIKKRRKTPNKQKIREG